MVNLIRPENILSVKREQTPDKLIEAFNELIAQMFTGTQAEISRNQVVAHLCIEVGFDVDQLRPRHWFDIAILYRSAGWRVEYKDADDNEAHRSRFIFRPPNQ